MGRARWPDMIGMQTEPDLPTGVPPDMTELPSDGDATVDIVVVNYKTPGDLEMFLESLLIAPPATPFSLTIVNVSPGVDDVRVAEAALLLTEGVTTETRLLMDSENIGYARACNAAAAVTNHRYLAFFNADVLLTTDAIDGCVEALERYPKWGVLGPRQIDERGRMTHAGIFGTRAAPVMRAWMQEDGRFDQTLRAVTVSGAAYFVRRTAWNELTWCEDYRRSAPMAEGAFLPTSHYFEETYCSYHAIEHGWEVVYYGPVVIVHKWHKASPVGGWAEQQFPRSQAIFRKACHEHDIPFN